MMLLDTHVNPRQLWLAAAPTQGDDASDEQDRHPDLDARSLRVLIVEDEFFISLHIKSLLRALGHVVVGIAVSADDAVRLAQREQPDVALMDIRLIGPRDGIDAAGEIFNSFGVPSIFVTANTDPQTRGRAQAVQPLGFLEKPVTAERLKIGLRGVPAP
jgi:CheY-like chemotaxis protein